MTKAQKIIAGVTAAVILALTAQFATNLARKNTKWYHIIGTNIGWNEEQVNG